MRQLSPLDAQFLNVENPTTVGHVGSLLVLDPTTAPGGGWGMERVRDVLEGRIHLSPLFRQRLAEVPLGLTRPYWVDDPHFDLEFHLREVTLPQPGDDQQLGEQVARLHAVPLDRSRPLWEVYVIAGLAGGRTALYAKVHHCAIDGISGSEILATVLDADVEPAPVEPEAEPFVPRRFPSTIELLGRGVASLYTSPAETALRVPAALRYLDQLPGAAAVPLVRTVSETAGAVGRMIGAGPRGVERRSLRTPRTPLNGGITAHRRFAFGSVPLGQVRAVRRHCGGTVHDTVMALVTTALRRWLLDHDALPETPLVVAVPVSTRVRGRKGEGNEVSVMLVELPTQLRDPGERHEAVRESLADAKRNFEAVPARLLQDLALLVPTALNGLGARALFRLATIPGPPCNLMVSNVPGPPRPLYVAGARVEGIYPVSVLSDLTGGLNITLFSYNGALDFGLIACRESVPDVWNLIDYLHDALAEALERAEADPA